MFAIINIPGSQHHNWFHGTKKECLAWFAEREKKASYPCDYLPQLLLSDKNALRQRYQDGTRIYSKDPIDYLDY